MAFGKRKIVKEGRPVRDTDRITLMFVDVNNDLQSQVAEHYINKFYPKIYQAFSGGPDPDTVDCDLIITLYERGEDIRRHRSKGFESEYLLADHDYDYVIYLHKSVFDEYASKTVWKGRQILADMGSREDFKATDDRELAEEMWAMNLKIRDWVKETFADPENLKKLVTA